MNRYPPKKTGNGVRNALLAFTAVSLVAGASAASAGVIKGRRQPAHEDGDR